MKEAHFVTSGAVALADADGGVRGWVSFNASGWECHEDYETD